MKTSKNKIFKNIAFLVFIALFLFTPLGTFVKVQLNRLIVFAPKTIEVQDQKVLSTYQWQLVNATGKNVSLEEFKGKIIFINFWATWCPPCIAEMPSLQKLYNDYQNKVVFLFVTTDPFEKANKFLDKEKLSLPIFQPLSNPPLEMESSTIPATYVIDKEGNIIVAKIGTADWNSDSFRKKIDEYLQK
ncbi:TlpA disulfide reductase family protein [Flavobacterium sp. PL12]|uniref:TlpA family protein disulfide reductase n=1 Tax=Flavobacterium sp. PL12 TaxID=3071718 RepID=UPI00319E4763